MLIWWQWQIDSCVCLSSPPPPPPTVMIILTRLIFAYICSPPPHAPPPSHTRTPTCRSRYSEAYCASIPYIVCKLPYCCLHLLYRSVLCACNTIRGTLWEIWKVQASGALPRRACGAHQSAWRKPLRLPTWKSVLFINGWKSFLPPETFLKSHNHHFDYFCYCYRVSVFSMPQVNHYSPSVFKRWIWDLQCAVHKNKVRQTLLSLLECWLRRTENWPITLSHPEIEPFASGFIAQQPQMM